MPFDSPLFLFLFFSCLYFIYRFMLPNRFETFIRILALSALSFWLPTATRSPSSTPTPTPTPSPKLSQFTFPVKVGPTGRYLVDQNHKPWMLIADSAWTILSHFSPTQQ